VVDCDIMKTTSGRVHAGGGRTYTGSGQAACADHASRWRLYMAAGERLGGYPRSVSLTGGQLVVGLVVAVPEASGVIADHLDDYDALLLHLLAADLLRFTVAAWDNGDRALASRSLAFVDLALREGDEQVVNALCVSFIENVGAGVGETPAFIESWPHALAAELASQRIR